jgi:hypothetical protein
VQCTFYGNSSQYGSGILGLCGDEITLSNTIIAFNSGGAGVEASLVEVSCTDIFGNAGGDWTGILADELGTNGNISDDPLFCDPEHGDLKIRDDSPCAHGVPCGLIGALPVGCLAAAAEEWTVPGGALRIGPCTPNPLSESTRIAFEIPGQGSGRQVRIVIYDATGRRVRALTSGVLSQGIHETAWDARDDRGESVKAGTYFCRIECGGQTRTASIVVLR